VTTLLFRGPVLGGRPPPMWTYLIPVVVLFVWMLVRR